MDHRATLEGLKEFARARQRGLGASDMPGVLDLGGDWKNPISIYADKVAGPDGKISEPQLWGHLHEPTVAAEYERRYDVELEKPEPFIEHPSFPFLFANLDRRVVGDRRPVEIKTASSWAGWGPEGTDEVPLPYGIQCQFQMAIVGEPEMDLAVLIAGNDFRVYTLRADEHTQASLVRVGVDFWTRVQRRMPPPADWKHPETAKAIARLYRPVEKSELVVEPDKHLQLMLLVDKLAEVKAGLKDLKADEEVLKAQVAQEMGTFAIARMPSGAKVTRSVVRKKSYTVQPQEYVELRLTPAKGE